MQEGRRTRWWQSLSRRLPVLVSALRGRLCGSAACDGIPERKRPAGGGAFALEMNYGYGEGVRR